MALTHLLKAPCILLWFMRTFFFFFFVERKSNVLFTSFQGCCIWLWFGTVSWCYCWSVRCERAFSKKEIDWIQSATVPASRVQWAGGREGGETSGRALCCPVTITEDDKVIDQCCVLRIVPTVKLQAVALNVAGGFSAECKSRSWLDFFPKAVLDI